MRGESLTADVADLVPICTHSAKETLGMWLEDMAEMFEGGLVSDTTHNFCIFNSVDPASSHVLVSQSSCLQLCTCTDRDHESDDDSLFVGSSPLEKRHIYPHVNINPSQHFQLKILFWRNIVRFWKSYNCSNKLDV